MHNDLVSTAVIIRAALPSDEPTWRQLVPSATTMASNCTRTAGSSDSSAIAIETAWCAAS